jgi:site-specific DNA recombinase
VVRPGYGDDAADGTHWGTTVVVIIASEPASATLAWSKSTVRSILGNPRYTGHQVWNRQRRDEVLLDVQDVALGHETKMRWNSPDDWVWSHERTHEAVVAPELFAEAQHQRVATHRGTAMRPRRTRTYLLSGLLCCAQCGRRMQGQAIRGHSYYRCKFPAEYAIAQDRHAKTVYVREAAVVGPLDDWITTVFDAGHIDETCQTLSAASEVDDADAARAKAARRKVDDCDDRLRKYPLSPRCGC